MVARGRRQHPEGRAIQRQHLLVVRLHERVAGDSEREAPELQRHRVIEQHHVRQQLCDARGELIARPLPRLALEPETPKQAQTFGLHGQEHVLQVREPELGRRLGKRRQRLLDALVMDRACRDRLHGMRTLAVKPETHAVRRRDRLELAADPVSPWVLHAEHRRVGRQPQPRP